VTVAIRNKYAGLFNYDRVEGAKCERLSNKYRCELSFGLRLRIQRTNHFIADPPTRNVRTTIFNEQHCLYLLPEEEQARAWVHAALPVPWQRGCAPAPGCRRCERVPALRSWPVHAPERFAFALLYIRRQPVDLLSVPPLALLFLSVPG
jgi:hypothetical protein